MTRRWTHVDRGNPFAELLLWTRFAPRMPASRAALYWAAVGLALAVLAVLMVVLAPRRLWSLVR